MDGTMKIGINSYAYRWSCSSNRLTLEALIQKAIDHTLDVVQICDNTSVFSVDKRERERLAAKYCSRIEIETGCKAITVNDLSKNLLATKEIGAHTMRLVMEGENGERVDYSQMKQVLSSILPLLSELNISINIENHFGFFPQELVQLLVELGDSHLAICFDCFNSIAQNISTNEAFTILGPYVNEMHVKDVCITREGTGFKFSGCPLGTGSLNLQPLLQKLKNYKKEPILILEGWIDEKASLEETLAFEENINNQGIKYLMEVKGE
jgi:sugar phosphate isomerase/epimerase